MRRLRRGRRRNGFLSSFGPVADGVILAFAWNMAASHSRKIRILGYP